MLTTTNLQLFWTMCDSVYLTSGSIDVLGYQRKCITLADKIPAGFTTVTTSPRYLLMLCAAIAAVEMQYLEVAASSFKLRQMCLTAGKLYERGWALAHGLAAEASTGPVAVDGLRRIQSMRWRSSALSAREKTHLHRAIHYLGLRSESC